MIAQPLIFAPQRERGAALVVGLILLLVLTLFSLSALKNTTRQQRMTTNAEISLQSFVAAETGTRDVINEIRRLREAPEGVDYILQQSITNEEAGLPGPLRAVNRINGATINAELRYRGPTVAPGNSINLGSGQGFVLHQFEIDSQATLGENTDPLSRSFHRQGMAQLGPG